MSHGALATILCSMSRATLVPWSNCNISHGVFATYPERSQHVPHGALVTCFMEPLNAASGENGPVLVCRFN